jgi:hypothetical protein
MPDEIYFNTPQEKLAAWLTQGFTYPGGLATQTNGAGSVLVSFIWEFRIR